MRSNIDALGGDSVAAGLARLERIVMRVTGAPIDEAAAREEIGLSHASIVTELGMPPRHFAYPNGGSEDFGERDMRLVREAGFETATTSIEGINRPGADPYRLLRFNVHEARFRAPSGRLSRALFFSETSGLLGWLRGLRVA